MLVADTTRSNKRPVRASATVLIVLAALHIYKRSLSAFSIHQALKMAAVQALPKDVSKLGQEVKLFGKWDTQECVLRFVCC